MIESVLIAIMAASLAIFLTWKALEEENWGYGIAAIMSYSFMIAVMVGSPFDFNDVTVKDIYVNGECEIYYDNDGDYSKKIECSAIPDDIGPGYVCDLRDTVWFGGRVIDDIDCHKRRSLFYSNKSGEV